MFRPEVTQWMGLDFLMGKEGARAHLAGYKGEEAPWVRATPMGDMVRFQVRIGDRNSPTISAEFDLPLADLRAVVALTEYSARASECLAKQRPALSLVSPEHEAFERDT